MTANLELRLTFLGSAIVILGLAVLCLQQRQLTDALWLEVCAAGCLAVFWRLHWTR